MLNLFIASVEAVFAVWCISDAIRLGQIGRHLSSISNWALGVLFVFFAVARFKGVW